MHTRTGTYEVKGTHLCVNSCTEGKAGGIAKPCQRELPRPTPPQDALAVQKNQAGP